MSETRARVRKKGTENGASEGSGDGDGDSSSGLDSGKGVKDGLGKSFAFGRSDEKKKGVVREAHKEVPTPQSGPSKLSYRDKLLTPGCAGFLVKHSEEDDIVQGWKDFFNKMNKMEPLRNTEESDEDDDQVTRRREGKPGALKFTAEEYSPWCLPWMNSLIIKVLGANFPTYLIRDRINRMWRPRDPLKLIPLNNGYYIVSFSNKEDKEYAFQKGPWMIEDHYLIAQRWRPNFNPWKADLQYNIAAWIRLPDVPFEFYNVESLRRIGNMVGKIIKVDRSTSVYDKGGFARLCIEIDLKKPLLPTYMVFGEERPIIYEGLHHVCFECGKYGHQKGGFPLRQTKSKEQKEDSPTVVPDNEGEGSNAVKKKTQVGGRDTVITGGTEEGESPFGKLRILRLDHRGMFITADFKEGVNGAMKKTVDQGIDRNLNESQRTNKKQDLKQGKNENKVEAFKDKGPQKTEWVQVGAKRKNSLAGKLKGKENANPARERSKRVTSMGPKVESNASNPFQILQEVEHNNSRVGISYLVSINTKSGLDSNKTHTSNKERIGGPTFEPSSCTLGSMGVAGFLQDNSERLDPLLDTTMKDQDKCEGEPEIPLVSQ
ncbi:hypothetical protein K1719_020358 [Acacia pycnantha]|nr:hypothetical protein K1719_020358 [Acacia pycnantha]